MSYLTYYIADTCWPWGLVWLVACAYCGWLIGELA
jgi:hypothetical protein